ncbi:MAG TPA: polysialyltransferase family glycosyltransferase [Defluviitaleaceae bacterium]|nr:polysialyltransferase family glycosyltransferase [Defluviitaleaceae bacterium]
MKDVFLAFTPYHILLACALIFDMEQSSEIDLIIFRDFFEADKFANSIAKTEIADRADIYIRKGTYESRTYNSYIQRFIRKDSELNIQQENIRFIKNYFKENPDIHIVYSFNDARGECQLAYYLNKKRGGTNIYVEDGFAVYSTQTSPSPSIAGRVYNRVYNSPWHQFIKYHGGYKYTSKIMCLKPSLIRDELKCKPIQEISRKTLCNLKKNSITDILLHDYRFSRHKNIDTLIILPHSEFLQQHSYFEPYVDLIEKILAITEDLGMGVYVKYHPREKNYFLQSIDRSVELIPQGLPAEALFLHLVNYNPKLLLGDISTSLLTGKIICESTSVVSLLNLYGKDYFNTSDFMIKAGIFVPSNIHELKLHIIDILNEGL